MKTVQLSSNDQISVGLVSIPTEPLSINGTLYFPSVEEQWNRELIVNNDQTYHGTTYPDVWIDQDTGEPVMIELKPKPKRLVGLTVVTAVVRGLVALTIWYMMWLSFRIVFWLFGLGW